MTLVPPEHHTQHFLGIIGKHIVHGLAVGGIGFVGDQVFDRQFSLIYEPEDQIVVSALAPGTVQVGLIGRLGLVGAQDVNLA